MKLIPRPAGRTRLNVITLGLGIPLAVVVALAADGWWRQFEWGTRERLWYYFALISRHAHPEWPWADGDVASTALALPLWQRRIIERRAQKWADRRTGQA